MGKTPFLRMLSAIVLIWATMIAGAAGVLSAPQHGIAMYGAPALPPRFEAFPYVNPAAPRGGRIVLGEIGGFDSLNPFILKGRAPWAARMLVAETLMARNWDEPFSLYGLLAESIETPPDRSWVEFTLRPEARFSDGSPVTVADVMWSFETLGTQGHPRYRTAWAKVAKMEQTGPRSLRLTFKVPDRELPLIFGLRPILRKADWQGRDFAESSLVPFIGSGPYVIADFEPGRFISFRRNPGWWGRDLPVNRGKFNFDEIRYEYFADGTAAFEAFKAGIIDVWREPNAGRWLRDYGFPAVERGEVVKSEVPHQRPSGMRGFVMNERRSLFADWRARQAMIEAFNFDFINQTLNGGIEPRITSWYSNSVLGMRPGPARGAVRERLLPWRDSLPPGALEGYVLPSSKGDRRNRRGLRRARRLLEQAGWHVEKGVLRNREGAPFRFELLLRQGDSENIAVATIYARDLARLGIEMRIALVDSAQYRERLDSYDFDMTAYRRYLSLSPGNEQRLYFGSEGRSRPGTRNYMGLASPAVDGLIDRLLAEKTREGFIATVRALDRVLTAGRHVIPFWFSRVSRLAHRADLHYPARTPIYGDWIGFLPDIWWKDLP